MGLATLEAILHLFAAQANLWRILDYNTLKRINLQVSVIWPTIVWIIYHWSWEDCHCRRGEAGFFGALNALLRNGILQRRPWKVFGSFFAFFSVLFYVTLEHKGCFKSSCAKEFNSHSFLLLLFNRNEEICFWYACRQTLIKWWKFMYFKRSFDLKFLKNRDRAQPSIYWVV